MRVYVTVDIEGIAGVIHNSEGSPGNPEYERARRLMTAEASAVVAGIFDAVSRGAGVSRRRARPVSQYHPGGTDQRATLSRGKPRVYGMMHGVDKGYDLAMFIGVHGRAGTGASALSHTFTGTILDVRLHGASYGELGLNAAMAGAYDVPVVLVAGDQTVVAETRALLGDHALTVQVKESVAQMSAESVHPRVAQRMLREAAAHVVRERPNVAPLRIASPVQVEVELARPVLADLAEMIDGAERVNGRTVGFTRADMPSTYRLLRLITVLCSTPL